MLVCISNDCRLIFAILTARKWQPTNVLTFITKCCILQPATFAKSQHTRLSCTGHRFTKNSIKSAQINQKLRRKPIKMQRFHLNFERFCLIPIYPDLIEALNYIEILMRFFCASSFECNKTRLLRWVYSKSPDRLFDLVIVQFSFSPNHLIKRNQKNCAHFIFLSNL